MTLKIAILAALRSGEDDRSLQELVHLYQAQGMTPRDSYNVLQEIWQEFGFHETEESGPLRDALEYLMERVWFQGSGAH